MYKQLAAVSPYGACSQPSKQAMCPYNISKSDKTSQSSKQSRSRPTPYNMVDKSSQHANTHSYYLVNKSAKQSDKPPIIACG